mmetsp:Transcript_23227/g.37249  ORF Transcript_23227/g.37249 Transcript_23227/m.37249 type:complete len:115 (+) Transcript_23227:114-458(+)
MPNALAFSPRKQLLDVKESKSSQKTIAVVNRGDHFSLWNPLTEDKLSTSEPSKGASKGDILSVQLVHNAANTVVVSPGVKDTVIRLFDNEMLSAKVCTKETCLGTMNPFSRGSS